MRGNSRLIQNQQQLLELANEFGSTSTLRRIFRKAFHLANDDLLIKKEKKFRCKVYNEEYKNAYQNYFARYEKTCTRLHFFTNTGSKITKNCYIGNCVLRPIKPASISYAVMPFQAVSGADKYCLCTEKFVEKFNKNNFTVDAWPFIQQDGSFDRCAHVALYSINQYLAKKGLAKKMNISQIVKKAEDVPTLTREYPSEGLEILQIKYVLKEMGTFPIVYAYPSKAKEFDFPPQRIIYHYIESGFPVLLGIKIGGTGHALVALGHSFNPDSWLINVRKALFRTTAPANFYHCSTHWVDDFIISDDNLGPYLSVDKNFFEAQANDKESGLVIVVALPKNVLVKGEDAEIYAFKTLSSNLRQEISNLSEQSSSYYWFTHLMKHFEDNDIVLRTYLLKGQEIKQRFYTQDFPTEFTDNIRKTPLPEYVWVTELSTPGIFAQSRKHLGTIVVDPTGDPLVSKNLLLIRHLPGILHCRNAKTDKMIEYVFEDDLPRRHLKR